MSPRSEEFIEQARERLADAQKILGLVHPAVAANTAYYAMLNAARAALSERGEHAKTHKGHRVHHRRSGQDRASRPGSGQD